MQATALLRGHHREIDRLFDAVAQADGDPRPHLDALAAALAAHMSVEHVCLYPLAVELAPTLVAESYEEHALMELALKRLMMTTVGTEELRARVTVLRELVTTHVRDEETSLFPRLDQALGPAEQDALGTELGDMHRLLLERAVPFDRTGASGTWPIVREHPARKRARSA